VTSLESLARERFGDLTAAEILLIQAAFGASFAVCGPNDNDADPHNDPGNANEWGESRQIRMELIRWLCVNRTTKDLIDPKGINVYGARLIGILDLSQIKVPFPLALIRCRITHETILRAAEIPMLLLDGTWAYGIKADGVEVKGGITLRNGFRTEQEVRLQRARIGVDLDCSGGTFINPIRRGLPRSGKALSADGATFGGGVLLSSGLHAEGEVRFSRAHIRGDLNCSDGTFHNPPVAGAAESGVALNADGINVEGGAFLHRVHSEGEVRFPRAKIIGDLDCRGAKIANPFLPNVAASSSAMNIEGADIGGSLMLSGQFHANGSVSLRGVQIAGQLDCIGGTFENRPRLRAVNGMAALDACVANVARGIRLKYPFHSEGEVRLDGSQVGRILDCSGGVFNNPPLQETEGSGYALTAHGITVTGNVVLGHGFRANGEVGLVRGEIRGDLECDGGEFDNPPILDTETGNRSLSAHSISVKGNVYMRQGFQAQGEVSFSGATIDGNLEVTGGKFQGELNLESTSVKGVLMWTNIVEPAGLRLNLTNASIRAIADDSESWPSFGKLLLDGFVYERFTGHAPKDASGRLNWLALQETFMPQPYRQLASVLREEGENDGAIQVLIALERRLHKRENRRWYNRLWSNVLDGTIAYGYRPGKKALKWLAAIILFGFIFYALGYYARDITPTDKNAYDTYRTIRQIPPHYERFHALVYSIENTLPFVRFGQIDRWQADPDPQTLVQVTVAGALRWFRWVQILSGWILSTLFLAGVTGIVRRD
jgi:hypothetical protein